MTPATLLLRVEGPLQSWGTASAFDVRDSGREPSKSGIIGLLCAALGRPRTAPVDDLASLSMGVRIDAAGSIIADFHTAGGGHERGVPTASGARGRTVITRRMYLQDAAFLVGLFGASEKLEVLAEAVRGPVWPLCLGRRACVPSRPLVDEDSLVSLPLLDALTVAPWEERPRTVTPGELEVLLETRPDEGAGLRNDQPLGAAFLHRSFGPRYVRSVFVPVTEVQPGPGASLA